jgi:uncharacterized hydrophobic protein (TIGR00271 family)
MRNRIREQLFALRGWWTALARSVDHEAVIESVDNDGHLSASYLFMCVMSAGIAVTGLLVNSPAVIIGAMLISPLMAPIVRLGLGVATLDHERARGALGVLLAGMGFALVTAVSIVWMSPIRDLTPEIAARTHPNLFDLLIAVLSGLAGGYAMVRGRGGAIVGVAIATALMPPMAVVGYGLASSQWAVARGSLLLFTTNLVAIALSVTAITTWYGFSRRRVRHAVVWQTGLAFLLILPLTFPLWHSLLAISQQAQLVRSVRQSVAAVLGADQSRIISLQVGGGNKGKPTRVDLTLAARHYDRDADQRLRAAIDDVVDGPLDLRLSPIEEADLADSVLSNPVAALPVVAPPQPPHPAEVLLDNFPIPLAAHELDIEDRRMVLYVGKQTMDLAACRDIEAELHARFNDWSIRVAPPVQGLPEIPFAKGSAVLGITASETVDLIAWTLASWNVRSVRVFGFASSEGGGNARLAKQRAESVAQRLSEAGFESETVVAFRQPDQERGEIDAGRVAFRVALVTPLQQPAPEPVRSEGVSLPRDAALRELP